MTFNATDAQRLRDLAFNAGYWLLPITPGKKKPAIRGWQEKRCENLALINRAQRIGLVMGKKNLWAFDVDSKHWPKSKDAFNKMLHDHIDSEFDPDEYLHQETPSGGLHFVFKINDADWTDKTMGNQKFAKNHEGEVVLESRGAGGQILIYKEAILSKLESLKEVSSSRIYELVDWANSFDKKPEKKKQYNETVTITSKHQSSGSDSFKEFNELYKDLPLQYLQKNGFTIVGENKIGIQVKRPGDSTSSHSGVIFHDTGGLQMFSTSTDFEAEEVYTPFDIFKIQNNIDDNHEAIMLAKEQRLIADDIDELMEGIEVAEKKPIKLKAKDFIKDGSLPPFIKTLGEYVEIGKELPPIKGYFDRWISSNAVTMFFAPTGVGKSIAMMYISELVTKGLSFEPELPNENEPKNVFYIDMELREEDIYDRYPNYLNNKRFFRFQKPVQGEPHYDQYWDMSGHDQLEFLLESSESIENLGLIVVDNLSFFFPDEGDVKVGKKLMGLLSNHAKSRGCAIVVINHKTKANSQTGRLTADQMRGTGRLLDLSDYVFMLNRLENDLMYFQFNKGRNYKGFRSLDEVLQIEKTEINGMLGFKPVQWIKEAELLASVQAEKTPEQLHKEQQLAELGCKMYEHQKKGNLSLRKIAEMYDCSHTQVKRYIDKYLSTIPVEVIIERGKNIPVEESKIEL